jgi:GTP cyclohydrolase I
MNCSPVCFPAGGAAHFKCDNQAVDEARIAAAVTELLSALGEDVQREGLSDTPARVARMYREICRGLHSPDPGVHLEVQFAEDHKELVLLRDIPFHSICEHHLLPFFGKAHLAYIPDGRITGISKLARVLGEVAARPQVQERLTSAVADLMMDRLAPRGAAVVIEARHMCMEMRGVRAPGTTVTTSALRGLFRDDPKTRMELFTLLGSKT